jgi:hypothetical protein
MNQNISPVLKWLRALTLISLYLYVLPEYNVCFLHEVRLDFLHAVKDCFCCS